MRITLLSILVLALVFSTIPAMAQQETIPIQAPETIEETQEFGLQILRGIPGAVQEVWDTQVVPLWSKMWSTIRNIWDTYLSPWLLGLWERFLAVFGQEIEKRKPLIEEEFQKEKGELKLELQEKIPESGKTLWELLKGYLPGNEAD